MSYLLARTCWDALYAPPGLKMLTPFELLKGVKHGVKRGVAAASGSRALEVRRGCTDRNGFVERAAGARVAAAC